MTLGDFELHAGRGETHTTGETRIVIRPERVQLEPHGVDRREPRARHGRARRLPGQLEPGDRRLANGDKVQALVQNTGEELTYKQGDPVRVDLPSEALRVLTDTGIAPIDEDAPCRAGSAV